MIVFSSTGLSMRVGFSIVSITSLTKSPTIGTRLI